jgi:type II restriction enzyme
MDPKYADGFKSPSQIARRLTEAWAARNLYCVACKSGAVEELRCNVEAVDFACAQCSATYQLKAMRRWNERRIPDAGYQAMMRALRSDSVPNLLVMQYDDCWKVCNLLLVPSFFFSAAAVQPRRPLGPTARRAGWIGCNILLCEIAEEGKIPVISHGISESPRVVRKRYDSLRPLAKIPVRTRGWTLDVLRMVRRLGRDCFSLQDVYAYEDDLSAIYPGNRNVRPKIRQQLQVLRDLGFLAFEGGGQYQMLR